MRTIDLDTWKRREHFEFFRRADLPFYNVNANVDITGLPAFTRSNDLSFNTTLIFLVVKALSGIENFRYRLRGESVVDCGPLHPSFACIRPGEELFRFITLDFIDDLPAFDAAVREAIASSDAYFALEKLAGRDDFAFLSSIPWISFTGIDHTLSLKKDDGIPRVTWGKYFQEPGRTLIPFNIQVNHMFVDGLHVGRFFEALDRELLELRQSPEGTFA